MLNQNHQLYERFSEPVHGNYNNFIIWVELKTYKYQRSAMYIFIRIAIYNLITRLVFTQ